MTKRPQIFESVDWRKFLKEMVEYCKEVEGMSHRDIVKKAGLKSPGYLSRLLGGERRISVSVAERLAKALKLTASETRYLVKMAEFVLEANSDRKEERFRALLKIQERFRPSELLPQQFSFYSKWYLPVIFEAAGVLELPRHKRTVIEELRISESDFNQAIQVLKDLGFLKMEANRLVRGKANLSTPVELENLAVRRFHLDILKVAEQRISELPKDERVATGMTIALNESEFESFKSDFNDFMDKMAIKYDAGDKEGACIYHAELLLFPVIKFR